MTNISFTKRGIIWLLGVSFVLFQFFLQLSSGVVIGTIMQDYHLSALVAGLLSGTFYITYTILQIPVGILFDRKNTQLLLSSTTILCSIGCFIFASSTSLFGLFLGRFLIGTGSAFAFVGLSHLLRLYFKPKQFAFMIGLSETLGFIATVIGMITLGALVSKWGWRYFINIAGVFGLTIGLLSKFIIPATKPSKSSEKNYLQQLIIILKNKHAWINGVFVGLTFSTVTVFGALWAVPFIKVKLNCNLTIASIVTAMFFLGTALSCPLFGWLSAHVNKRKNLILGSCLSTSALLILLLYIPTESKIFIAILMFLIGTCCGAYMLAYTIANELAPKNSLSTCTGFTNTLAVITTPLLQPLIGYLLDSSSTTKIYTVADFKIALLIIPISLLIASILVCFLPEKNS